jgi:shikimate dehydrogenase
MTTPGPWACVTGWPIAHSRSPIIHRHWLEVHGVEGAYEKIATPPGEFARFARGVGAGGLRGANVTVPHKEAAFAACDRLTPSARAIGAVNTLWREGGELWGDNTDAEGFLGCLDEAAPDWRGQTRSALVLGAGGAARAVVHALRSIGVERVKIANRTVDRARALAAAAGPGAGSCAWSEAGAALREVDLLVNTTSLGMAGQPGLELDLSRLAPRAIVADIVYVPLRTPLLDDAERRGHRVAGGLGMLLHQAAPGFERWFGVRPRVTPELRALVEADVTGRAS